MIFSDQRIPRCLPLKDLAADRLERVATGARPQSMACTPAGIHLGFALREGGGVALRLTRDEALELRGWLINASGLPAIEPRERSLRAVSGAVPQVVVNLGTGRTGFVRDPSTGELTPSLTPPPAPAAKPDPLAGLRAVLARVPELYSNLPVGDPRGVMAAADAKWEARDGKPDTSEAEVMLLDYQIRTRDTCAQIRAGLLDAAATCSGVGRWPVADSMASTARSTRVLPVPEEPPAVQNTAVDVDGELE